MTSLSQSVPNVRPSKNRKRLIAGGVIALLLVAMVWDTTFVSHDGAPVAEAGFSTESYGQKQFPTIRKTILSRAAPAPKLARALADDKDAAIEQYGIPGDIAPVLSVKFTGTVASCDSGICTIDVPDMPDGAVVRLQVGPAINGTALRDGVGGIAFGDFKNQIEYQDAAAGINDAMKQAVLADLDRDSLVGKTVTAVGVFQLIIPNNWLVTPVALSVGNS